MCIYLVFNQINGKIYIGQTSSQVNVRWSQHLYAARNGKRGRLYAAIRKYGEDSFIAIELATVGSRDELNTAEKRFIAGFNSMDDRYGYNITKGANNINRMFGSKNPNFRGRLSPEQAEARRKKISEGVVRKVNTGWCARTWTAEEKTQRSKKLAGNKYGCYPKSPEHRQKISDARKRYWESRKKGGDHGTYERCKQ